MSVMQDKMDISFMQLTRQFPNDEAARIHFEEQRWGESLKVFTIRTSIVMRRSHISLRSRLIAFYLDITARKSTSVVGIHTDGIEGVCAVLERAYHVIYHGFSTKHAQLYVNEVAFRLNDGNVNVHVKTRMNRLREDCVGKRITYKELIADAA